MCCQLSMSEEKRMSLRFCMFASKHLIHNLVNKESSLLSRAFLICLIMQIAFLYLKSNNINIIFACEHLFWSFTKYENLSFLFVLDLNWTLKYN